MQKLNFFKGKDISLEELDSAEAQVARFVTFARPTEAPQIIDLKAMRQSIRPQLTLIHIDHTHNKSWVQRPQAKLNGPELRLQRSFETSPPPTETGTPLRRNPQQVFVFEATSERPSAAVLDDIADYDDYELLDDDNNFDLDWSLLDLPENVYGILANESRHT